MSESEGAPGFREYLGLLRRRWRLIVLVTAVVMVAALAYSLRTEPTYKSQAAVLVRAVTADPLQTGGSDTVNLETEKQLVLSTTVAERAAKELRYAGPPTDLVKYVSVSVPADTQVLVVEYSAPDANVARRGAQAFAEAYLSYRQEKASEVVTSAGSTLQERTRLLQQQLIDADTIINDPNAEADRKRQATASRDFLLAELGVLRVQSASLSVVDISPGEVIEPARVPDGPASPNVVLNTLGGLFVGLILALALAIIRDRSVEILGGREGLERLLDRPVLGAIPIDIGWKERARPRLVATEDPAGPVAEAYRALATKLLLLARRRDVKTILIMSPSAGEGRTSIAANLALALVEARWRVLVISADTRRPRIPGFFGVTDEVGLLNALADEVSVEEVTQSISIPRPWEETSSPLQILPTGHALTTSMRGLNSEALGSLLKHVREEFDLVLLDSPAASLTADAFVAASEVDGILLIADATTTKPEQVRWLREQLEQVDASILGGVLNRDRSPRWAGYHQGAPEAY
jgi:succinoglycan biosynthesis transport protein ExoP